MLLEAETNKYCPGGYDIGAISNLITWVLNFFLSAPSECVLPRALSGWGVNISEDAKHWIGLLQYNASTVLG
jgi:hypothetical protein